VRTADHLCIIANADRDAITVNFMVVSFVVQHLQIGDAQTVAIKILFRRESVQQPSREGLMFVLVTEAYAALNRVCCTQQAKPRFLANCGAA
jgi:hypothetical protein